MLAGKKLSGISAGIVAIGLSFSMAFLSGCPEEQDPVEPVEPPVEEEPADPQLPEEEELDEPMDMPEPQVPEEPEDPEDADAYEGDLPELEGPIEELPDM